MMIIVLSVLISLYKHMKRVFNLITLSVSLCLIKLKLFKKCRTDLQGMITFCRLFKIRIWICDKRLPIVVTELPQ